MEYTETRQMSSKNPSQTREQQLIEILSKFPRNENTKYTKYHFERFLANIYSKGNEEKLLSKGNEKELLSKIIEISQKELSRIIDKKLSKYMKKENLNQLKEIHCKLLIDYINNMLSAINNNNKCNIIYYNGTRIIDQYEQNIAKNLINTTYFQNGDTLEPILSIKSLSIDEQLIIKKIFDEKIVCAIQSIFVMYKLQAFDKVFNIDNKLEIKPNIFNNLQKIYIQNQHTQTIETLKLLDIPLKEIHIMINDISQTKLGKFHPLTKIIIYTDPNNLNITRVLYGKHNIIFAIEQSSRASISFKDQNKIDEENHKIDLLFYIQFVAKQEYNEGKYPQSSNFPFNVMIDEPFGHLEAMHPIARRNR